MTEKEMLNSIINELNKQLDRATSRSEDLSQRNDAEWEHAYQNGKMIAYMDAIRRVKKYIKEI